MTATTENMSMKLLTPCCNDRFVPISEGGIYGEEVTGYECLNCPNEWDKTGELSKTSKTVLIEGYEYTAFGKPEELNDKIEEAQKLIAKYGYWEGSKLARGF